MRNTVFALLLMSSFAACSQKEASQAQQQKTVAVQKDDIHITDLSLAVEKNKFPLIHLSKNKDIEDKINTVLQLEQLQHVPGVFKKNPFEKVVYGDDNNLGGSVNFDNYTSNSTISNVLSLDLNGAGTGAYTEDFTYYYNFDLRTGNKILLQQLFTEDGLTALTQSLNLRVKKKIDDYLVKIQTPGSNQSDYADDSVALDDEEGMYEECLGSVMDYKAEYYSFYFTNDSITFERERCSNHAMMALDELGRFDITLSFKELKQYLSPYGESLLNNNMDNIQSSAPDGKLYKGFINGKYPIHAFVPKVEEDGSLTMMYWYDKTKTPIEWNGTFERQHFSLTESNDNGDMQIAKIEADWANNNKIIGTWMNSKTKEVLKLELDAY